MITVLTGENSFEIDREVRRIVAGFHGTPERVDGVGLVLRQVPDLLMGATLFAEKRLVIIKNLSENKTVWADFADWLPRVSDDIELVLVEPKPDKRTKTYKELQKVATVREYKPWGERDASKAEQWVQAEAQAEGVQLDAKLARLLVERVGVDQWALAAALYKLAVLDTVTPEVIADVIESNPSENVFQLFDAALRGDSRQVRDMLATLELTEDPYRLFGLLSGQAFQLAVLANADKPSGEVAKDIGAHPFVLSKLTSHAKRLGAGGVRRIVRAFAEADHRLKTSVAEPWIVIEGLLQKVAAL